MKQSCNKKEKNRKQIKNKKTVAKTRKHKRIKKE